VRGYVVQNASKRIVVVTLDVIGCFSNEVRTIRQDPQIADLGLDAGSRRSPATRDRKSSARRALR
jgi:hypothetical protein